MGEPIQTQGRSFSISECYYKARLVGKFPNGLVTGGV